MPQIVDAIRDAVLPHIPSIVGALLALILAALSWARARIQSRVAQRAAVVAEETAIYTGDRGADKMREAMKHFAETIPPYAKPLMAKPEKLIERHVPRAQRSVFPVARDEAPTRPDGE